MSMRLRDFSYPTLQYIHSLWLGLTNKCQCFQKHHPFCICSLYWLSGLLSRPYPACGAILLIILHLFTPKKQPKYQILLGICFLVPLFTCSPPPLHHAGPASGKFFIKYKYKRENSYLGEALVLNYPCGTTYRQLPSCIILSATPLEIGKKYYLQGARVHHTSQFIFQSNDRPRAILPSKISQCHSYLRHLCEKRLLHLFSSQDVGKFASSLVLGTPLPSQIKKHFQNKGLAHLFAISGWHFSLLSSGVFILLSFFPTKIKCGLALPILSLFTLLFPFSPSVWRSWVSFVLFCISPYFSGSCSSLNRLGVGFIVCSSIFSIYLPDFSLSFLATLGILLFFSRLFYFLYSPWEQVAPSYCQPILRYILGSISLSISSQIFLIFPIMKFFGSLPLEGYLYNLFVPLILLPLFFLICFSFFLPFFAPITELYIHYILSFPWLYSSNIFLSLSLPFLSPLPLTLLFSILFLIGIGLEKTQTTNITQ
ncbi:ComEC/Rec2 family competence protein [Chlamydia gallinacea]|uniref:ComEC/Rec2 family competence protein n=1 Tax=Chlamydia gallinacea TaxID=1457153 RepID=UPI001C8401B0|nr:ComEC/Rec2 family competence protein [Chlamydia gallinacea]MBX6687954.1 ComEC/Rec2 family competence protein [Chlamydia gallinacea]